MSRRGNRPIVVRTKGRGAWIGRAATSPISATRPASTARPPRALAFAALAAGRSPGRGLKPKRLLELGFGQGFGLGVLAAANPDVAFEGIDFNPEHVAHARRLVAAAGLENLAVSETSFEEAAARGGESDADVVALHGIFSWVAPRHAGRHRAGDLRQRLQPDGIAYVSYNSMPGWAPLAPIRQLMLG